MKKGGHNFHPSRTSGIQKQLRARDFDKLKKKKDKKLNKPLDLSKPNWSI
jgi:hypothetical protein